MVKLFTSACAHRTPVLADYAVTLISLIVYDEERLLFDTVTSIAASLIVLYLFDPK